MAATADSPDDIQNLAQTLAATGIQAVGGNVTSPKFKGTFKLTLTRGEHNYTLSVTVPNDPEGTYDFEIYEDTNVDTPIAAFKYKGETDWSIIAGLPENGFAVGPLRLAGNFSVIEKSPT